MRKPFRRRAVNKLSLIMAVFLIAAPALARLKPVYQSVKALDQSCANVCRNAACWSMSAIFRLSGQFLAARTRAIKKEARTNCPRSLFWRTAQLLPLEPVSSNLRAIFFH